MLYYAVAFTHLFLGVPWRLAWPRFAVAGGVFAVSAGVVRVEARPTPAATT